MTLDVLIPVYNAADYVERAAASALACPGARVILVDDGSTDGSGELCDRLAADDRVRVLHQENCGASAARNAALDASAAEFVLFLDADDLLLPQGVSTLLAHVGDADAAHGRTVRTPQSAGATRAEVLPAREAAARAMNDPTAHLHLHGWVFRREWLQERFDEALSLGEDGEWLLRQLKGGYVVWTDAAAYVYSVRADSSLHGGSSVADRYLDTLRAAEESLAALNMPQEAAMYRLSHLLLMLTHGPEPSAAETVRLLNLPVFAQAMKTVRLRGCSPRIWTLRLLKWRLIRPALLAVRLRRRQNRRSAAGMTY